MLEVIPKTTPNRRRTPGRDRVQTPPDHPRRPPVRDLHRPRRASGHAPPRTRTASTVNEITAIGTGTVGLPVWATPKYDSAGNTVAFIKPSNLAANLTGIYDAWNRLVAVKDGSSFVAAYVYDGLRRRVVKKTYTGGTLTETRDYYFSDQWQVLSEAVSGTTDKTYAWGLRYVDELIWRNDSTYGRLYAMQDANFNCTAICDTSGSVLERYQFDPYGNRVVLDASWSVISASAYDWAVAHQGLMIETDVGFYNCRNRVYSPLLGVWLQRDPARYADGMNLYEYVRSSPIIRTDSWGLAAESGDGGGMASLIAGCMAQAGPAPTPPTFTLPYPTVPCGTAQRIAACNRWATQQCNSRAGCRASVACCNTCITTASQCCSSSGCNAPGSASRCTSAGVKALGKCNSQIPPAARRKCFAACMAAGMTPACSFACSVCEWIAPPPGYAACLALCAAAKTPGLRVAQVPYWTCVWECILIDAAATIEICPACAGCVGALFFTCRAGCGY